MSCTKWSQTTNVLHWSSVKQRRVLKQNFTKVKEDWGNLIARYCRAINTSFTVNGKNCINHWILQGLAVIFSVVFTKCHVKDGTKKVAPGQKCFSRWDFLCWRLRGWSVLNFWKGFRLQPSTPGCSFLRKKFLANENSMQSLEEGRCSSLLFNRHTFLCPDWAILLL